MAQRDSNQCDTMRTTIRLCCARDGGAMRVFALVNTEKKQQQQRTDFDDYSLGMAHTIITHTCLQQTISAIRISSNADLWRYGNWHCLRSARVGAQSRTPNVCVCGFNDISVEQLKQQQEQQQNVDELKNAPRFVCGRWTQRLRTQTWQPNERLRTPTCKLKHINFEQHKTETQHLQQHEHLHQH